MTTTARSRRVHAPPERVWELLADFGGIARWAPVVDHASLLAAPADGAGMVGVVRRIQTGRRTVLERVVRWEEPTAIAYDIEGLPKAIRSLRNEWTLAPGPAESTEVSLATTVDCGPRPPQQLVARLVARRLAATVSDQLLAGLSAALEGTNRA